MQRRTIISACAALGAGTGIFTAPGQARAQPAGKVWRIGFLAISAGPIIFHHAFLDQLRSLGYVEGRNLVIEYRWAANREERLPELAAELVRLNVDLIFAASTSPAQAAKRATSTIPIVVGTSADPIGAGLIASLARPGGNVTGMSNMGSELAGKRLQMLRELLPNVRRIAVLAFRGHPLTPLYLEQAQPAARQWGMEMALHEAREPTELVGAFAAMQAGRAEALIVLGSPFTTANHKRIAELATQQRLPSMHEQREFVEAGGLMGYGPNLPEMFRRSAHLVDKILRGANPANLPVEQPTKFDLAINVKTARALGLTIPYALRLQATEMIE